MGSNLNTTSSTVATANSFNMSSSSIQLGISEEIEDVVDEDLLLVPDPNDSVDSTTSAAPEIKTPDSKVLVRFYRKCFCKFMSDSHHSLGDCY